MQQIQPDLLWIGNAGDLRDPSALHRLGIVAVVDVAFEQPISNLPRELIYCRFPLIDGGGNDRSVLLQAIRTTAELITGGKKTLIACSAGMSRSPSIAVFALASFLKKDPTELAEELSRETTLELSGSLWKELMDVFPQLL